MERAEAAERELAALAHLPAALKSLKEDVRSVILEREALEQRAEVAEARVEVLGRIIVAAIPLEPADKSDTRAEAAEARDEEAQR